MTEFMSDANLGGVAGAIRGGAINLPWVRQIAAFAF
jgi:hypothetical protein